MATLEIQPAEITAVDCYISSGSNSGTAFNNNSLLAGTFTTGGPGNFYRALERFSLEDLPAGCLVVSARLDLVRAGGDTVGTPTFNCERVSRVDWTEAATWQDPWDTDGGDVTVTNADSAVYPGTGNLAFTSLRNVVRDCIAEALGSVDLRERGPESLGTSNYLAFYSSADPTAANRPKLTIEYYLPQIGVIDNEDGTGATATISDTEPGSGNVVLVAPADVLPLVFVSAGSRSDDGTVDLLLDNGSYWACVQSSGPSGNVSSAPVLFTVSGSMAGPSDPSRISTTLPVVLAAVAARLRSQLSLTEATCYWMLDREEPTPTSKNFFVTIHPDGGNFDEALFDGGGENQLTDSTGIVVTIHTHTQLDRGGRDKEALFQPNKGLLPYMKPVLKALAGHDLVINDNGDTCLRELIRPVGYKTPLRSHAERWSRIEIYFALSFDWDMS
jgi:hypothetical protein